MTERVTLALAVLTGLAVGVIMGALGGGGAILVVPVLLYGFAMEPHAATTGSLVVVGIGAIAGAISHGRRGETNLTQGTVFGLGGFVGTTVGVLASAHVAPWVQTGSFALLLLVVATVMLRRCRPEGDDDTSGPPPLVAFSPVRVDVRRLLIVAVVATFVGALTGFFGVGGGFAIVPALVLLLDFPMPVAVGTSLLVIALNSATAFVARLATGVELDWPLLLVMTAGAIVGILVGGRVAQRVSARTLTRGFAGLLVLVAAYTAVRTVTG